MKARPTLTARSLTVGTRVPPLERAITVVTLAAYAGATWDWHRLHYDPEFARARGLPAPVVDGQMFGAVFAEAILDWLGPRAFIQRLGFRMKGMVFAGQTVRCDGEVTAIRPGRDHDVVDVAQRITTGTHLVAEGTAEVRLPSS